MWSDTVYHKDYTVVLFLDYMTYKVNAPDNHPKAREKVFEQYIKNDELLQALHLRENQYLLFAAPVTTIDTLYKNINSRVNVSVIPYGLALWSWCKSKLLLTDECVLILDKQAGLVLMTVLSTDYISPTRCINDIARENLESEIIRTVKFYEAQFKLNFTENVKILDNVQLACETPAQSAVSIAKFSINFKPPQLVATELRNQLLFKRVLNIGSFILLLLCVFIAWGGSLYFKKRVQTNEINMKRRLSEITNQLNEIRNESLINVKKQRELRLVDFVSSIYAKKAEGQIIKKWEIDFNNHPWSKKVNLAFDPDMLAIFKEKRWKNGLKTWEVVGENEDLTIVLTFD